MKRIFSLVIFLLAVLPAFSRTVIDSQWKGVRVAFLGDSITDARQVESTNNVYWNNLKDILGIEPYVYGISGHRMNQIIGQAEKLEAEHGQAVDAIIVFIGTNDYNGDIPLGEWYSYSSRTTLDDGPVEVQRLHRELVYDDSTFRGRANTTLRWLKTHYPDKQIIFLTPIHRGFARFSDRNIQPEESFANASGHFIDEYVQAVKEIADVWAVPVIDLASICGLYPMLDVHTRYFRNADTDRLHPNTPGQLRMAYALAYQLLAYPARFDKYVAFGFRGDSVEGCAFEPRKVASVDPGTVCDGDIIMLDESADDPAAMASVDALRKELENLGFTVVTVREMFEIRGKSPESYGGRTLTNIY